MNLTRRAFGAFLGASAAAFPLRLGQTPAFAREGAPRRGGTLTFGVETEPATLNGQINGQAKARVVLRNIFDSLLARSPSGETVPWLAEAYEIRDDGRTYVFTLREGIRFTDGLALDAEAVALNFRKIRDPAYGKGLATGPAARLVDAKPLDARRVSLTLSETYAPFLSFASGLEILSPAAFDSPELRSGGKSVAGTGPFVLETYVKGQEVRLVRNPDYRWGPANAPQQGPAYLDEVVYRFLPESAVRTGALASGQLDVIEGISGNDAAIFRDDESYSYQRAHNTGTPYSLFLNVEHGATADVAVRRALIAAVDVDRVVASIYRGERERAFGIASPVEGDFYDPAAQASAAFDPSLANRLLDEAGWRTRDDDGFRTRNGERLRIEVVQSQATVRDQRDVLLQAVQAQAKQNAGIDVALAYVDAGTYADRQKTGNYGSIPNSRTPADDGVDIEYHYLPVAEGGSVNYSRTADPQIRDWLREAASTLDRRARADLYARVQARALEQALVLPLYVPEDQIAAGAHVRGLRFRPYAQQPESAYGVWLDV